MWKGSCHSKLRVWSLPIDQMRGKARPSGNGIGSLACLHDLFRPVRPESAFLTLPVAMSLASDPGLRKIMFCTRFSASSRDGHLANGILLISFLDFSQCFQREIKGFAYYRKGGNIVLAFRIIGLMLLGGLCEIGGGYLVWKWMREGSSFLVGGAGLAILGLYGVVVTWQPLPFGRAYAAYGGVFVILSILWALALDGFRPDRWDWAGAMVIVSGVLLMVFGPRG